MNLGLKCSVMITTRNRVADLHRTLGQLKLLNPAPQEVLITADGCADNTVEMLKAETLKAETKNLRVIVNEVGRGSVASRDRMIREAQGDLVFSLDDDSYPEQPDCLDRIAKRFLENPKLAVLHFPQRTDEFPQTLTQTDFGAERPTRSFANSGAVLRRSSYLQLSGFVPRFLHMYEEPDYALQCWAAGHEVRYSPAVIIRHHYSGQNRNELRIHHRHARNEFWSTLLRCPLRYLPGMLLWRIFSQFRYACTRGWRWVVREPVWWTQVVAGLPHCLTQRHPVSAAAYRAWLQLP